ncbi:hypothetical protein GDO78_017231 [Eleutherodactylus coqui]|uniref:Uncharacterized protein n=1 Tax=Eleutherodactylus coqui TaxID=57060 RepID=A0A8J6B4N5_ELECQ|nr:hypothetical protein GDO78_017231 [Eleutherodactylus coqui]
MTGETVCRERSPIDNLDYGFYKYPGNPPCFRTTTCFCTKTILFGYNFKSLSKRTDSTIPGSCSENTLCVDYFITSESSVAEDGTVES